jgi:hypothetical protein
MFVSVVFFSFIPSDTFTRVNREEHHKKAEDSAQAKYVWLFIGIF